MSDRITIKDLECLVTRLNVVTKNPVSTYTKDKSGKYTANAGNYHLDGAYGGWKLSQICANGQGSRDVLYSGYVPKRELYRQIYSYLNGLNDAQTQEVEA